MTVEEETDALRAMAMDRMEELCRYLLSHGRKEGRRWLAGSINGDLGRSFDVNLVTGVFGDWATGEEMKQGPIDLWMAVRQVDFETAREQLAEWLGGPARQSSHVKRTKPAAPKQIILPSLERPTDEDLRTLSQVRSLEVAALKIAVQRGFLWCFDDERNGRCWVITDRRRRCAIRRRIDNRPFILSNGSKTKAAACYGSDMTAPIGYLEASPFPCIGIVEGGPNVLAVMAHALASGVEDRVAPICMPSTSAGFTVESLKCLEGKRSRIFIDNDPPGQKAAEAWALQLESAGIVVDGYSFDGLIKNNGEPVNDLNDLCEIDCGSWEANREAIESAMEFAMEGALQ